MSRVPELNESSTPLADLDPNPLAILDQNRRTVYGNPAARELCRTLDGAQFEGRRIGEILHCIHSVAPQVCGESPVCQFCGANNAILAGLEGRPRADECRITAHTPAGSASLEFAVQSRPVVWKGQKAVFCALRDISNEKRRKVLEQTFFHDILNAARTVHSLSEVLVTMPEDPESELAKMLGQVRDSSGSLLSEIRGQQVLLAAETGDFSVARKPVVIADCIKDAVVLVSRLESAATKRIVPVYPAGAAMVWTDPILLGQVLTNLLKNALEATLSGREVRICGQVKSDRVEFSVWNEGLISNEARVQMFQRSFSTKGAGRGIGTYSLRLFVESYLGGKVSFTSSACDGTTFIVSLPQRRTTDPAPAAAGCVDAPG